MNQKSSASTNSNDSLSIMTEDQFDVLRKREESIYRCSDYLSPEYQKKLRLKVLESSPPHLLSKNYPTINTNDMWRRRTSEWCYGVVDHFHFSREAVDATMSILDRYLSKRVVTKKGLQLAAMASLNISLKLYEPKPLKLSSLIVLGRGRIKKDDIVKTESDILQALEWWISPPTVISALGYFISFIEKDGDAKTRQDVEDLARYLGEVSVCDYFFVTKKRSSIALACLFSSFSIITREQQISVSDMRLSVSRKAPTLSSSEDVLQCKNRILAIYNQCDYHGQGDRVHSPDTLLPLSEPRSDFRSVDSSQTQSSLVSDGVDRCIHHEIKSNDEYMSQFHGPIEIYSSFVNEELPQDF